MSGAEGRDELAAPEIAGLSRRLAETPPDFLAEPRIGSAGEIDVAAIAGDLVWRVSGQAPPLAPLEALVGAKASDRNRLRLAAIGAWLLHDPLLIARSDRAQAMLAWLASGLAPLAKLVDAELFVRDPERREELARACLAALSIVPAGERASDASDRLAALDSVGRARLLEEARAAEERAREVREELAKKAAMEAAAKASRE